MQMFSVLNDEFLSHFYQVFMSRLFPNNNALQYDFLRSKGLADKLYTEQYPHHLNYNNKE